MWVCVYIVEALPRHSPVSSLSPSIVTAHARGTADMPPTDDDVNDLGRREAANAGPSCDEFLQQFPSPLACAPRQSSRRRRRGAAS
jgi:hypothetical protein